MQAKDILKNLIQFDTYKDKENKKIMNYIQDVLEKRDLRQNIRLSA